MTFTGSTFKADPKSLSDALKAMNRVIERRNTIPILGNVLLAFERDKLTMSGTDLDMTLTTEIPIACDTSGRFTVEARLFADTLKKLKGESVQITDNGDKCDVECLSTGARFSLATRRADDFPVLKLVDQPSEFHIPALQLRQGFDAAKSAMSTEETRYYLKGVFFHVACDQPPAQSEELCAAIAERAELQALKRQADQAKAKGEPIDDLLPHGSLERNEELRTLIDRLEAERCAPNVLRMAATDGHRLARVTYPLPEGAAAMADVIVPDKVVKIVHAMLGAKADGEVFVKVGQGRVTFQFGRYRLESKTIDGTFPDYTRVIPTMNDKRLSVDAAAMATAIETVTAVANEKTRAVTLSIAPDQPLILACTSAENGKAAAIVPAQASGAEHLGAWECPIGFNAAYLASAASHFTGDVELELADPAAPTLIRSSSRPELIFILMPMRTDGAMLTVEGVKRLNMNPVDALKADAASRLQSIEKVRVALFEGDKKLDARTARDAWASAQRTLGDMARTAVTFIARSMPRAEARQIVKGILADAAGDVAASRRSAAILAWLQGQPVPALQEKDPATVELEAQDPATFPDEPQAEAEPETEAADDGPEAGEAEAEAETPQLEAEAQPEPVTEAVPIDPAAAEAVAVQPPALDPPADVIAGQGGLPDVHLVKIEDVYGRVYFVDAFDYASDKPMLRRLHKSGAPFTESESKGGAWQRICRDNVKRRILARGSVDRPAKAKADAPAVDASAERIEALESALATLQAQVAALAAGKPAEAVLSEPEAVPAVRTRAAAHVRAIMAYLKLRAARKRNAELEAAHVQASRNWLSETEARRVAERKAERLDAAIECRDIALADVDQARAERDEALATVGRLTVRCDALERLAMASDGLDRMPAAEEKPKIILATS